MEPRNAGSTSKYGMPFFLAIGIAAAGFWIGAGISELSNISVEISHEE